MILKGINMKRLAITLMSIIMLMDFTSAYAWGPKGHDVVAAIAEQHLTPKAKRKINMLLEGKSIVYYSSWMDNIQNSPYWEYGYNKTKTWHYANVDKGLTYETMPKNENGDVVNGLEMLTKEMTENYKELTDIPGSTLWSLACRMTRTGRMNGTGIRPIHPWIRRSPSTRSGTLFTKRRKRPLTRICSGSCG